ncbi:Predicted arabinose efflux permease, MFS family [Geoalkalibacter ferrihydriticus]|uniref:Predicted arabinose efflux permease, MFS family n=1 Tax=Geoalkalibacter ferrihydriticus TaxID=392333 RepID=A0A1G9RKG0_9BACT|nr:MFS transporter [Geoalkalibacter ferrihydriticus]SDM22905.1 Predicted arabinose efflux permease, MFS family [Geoalkalibacter ferrihydriticus]
MTYFEFIRQHPRLALFGPVLSFFSNFGQTFFISLFLPFFLTEFGLTNASFGGLYSAATLGGALTLMWVGQLIDRYDLKLFSALVAFGIAAAALLMSASTSVWMLFIALFGLRLFGQGLANHTAQTTMARYFFAIRGKALSVSALGLPLGEAILPSLGAFCIAYLGWRGSWLAIGVLVLVVLVPLLQVLLKSLETHPARWAESHSVQEQIPQASWTRRQVLRDPRFFCILPASLLSPFLLTGLFLYQLILADYKGWSVEVMAGAFVVFAGARVVCSLTVGPLIDRFTARRLFPLLPLPLLLGIFSLWRVDAAWAPFVYLLFAGMTEGMGISVKNALWAELYGTRTLGAIRSMLSTFILISTAVSPLLFGWLLDVGIGFGYILPAACLLIAASILLALLIFRMDPGGKPIV